MYFILFKHPTLIITVVLVFIFFSKPFIRRKKKKYWLHVFKEKTNPERYLGNLEHKAETGFLILKLALPINKPSPKSWKDRELDGLND